MKKLFNFVILILLSLTTFAQSNENKTDTSNVSFREIYNDVKESINSISVAIKKPTEHVYSVLVTQSTTNSIINLALYLVFGLLLTYIWIYHRKEFKKTNIKDHPWYGDDIDRHQSIFIPFILFLTIGFIYILSVIFTITSTITGLVNPEYGALERISDLIHKN